MAASSFYLPNHHRNLSLCCSPSPKAHLHLHLHLLSPNSTLSLPSLSPLKSTTSHILLTHCRVSAARRRVTFWAAVETLDKTDTSFVDKCIKMIKFLANLTVDFGKTLKPNEHISMLRREVLDSYLRSRAESNGAVLLKGLVTNLDIPTYPNQPYIIHYTVNNTVKYLPVDAVVGADGANSRVAKAIGAGDYACAIAFQERIRLPEDKMEYYKNLAEVYLGNDVSPDFYAWVFPKCDHVAVGTGTLISKPNIKQYQKAIRSRVFPKIAGGKVIKVEAHPIPEHPRPVRVRGRVALVGDAAGYVTKCSGEGIVRTW